MEKEKGIPFSIFATLCENGEGDRGVEDFLSAGFFDEALRQVAGQRHTLIAAHD